eukprot:4715633-Alexandrium_andersonii.AAC.1
MVGRAVLVAAVGLGATGCPSCAGAGLTGKAFSGGAPATDEAGLDGGAFSGGTLAADVRVSCGGVKPAGGSARRCAGGALDG